MVYLSEEIKQEIRQKIDALDEGLFSHKRVIGEKIIPMHVHKNKGQFMYVEGKSIRIYYEIENDIKTLFLPPRHFAWMPANVMHSVESNHPDFVLRNIYYTNLGNDVFFKKVGVYAANDLLIEMLKYSDTWAGNISTSDEQKYTFLKAIQLILPDASNRKLPFALPFAKDERLQKILSYIQNQLMENINITDISTNFGFSPRSLLRLFQSDLKMTFAQYLKTLRTIKAIELLTTTNKTLPEIAFDVGYESFPTFSNTFFEIVGVRPKAYKRQ